MEERMIELEDMRSDMENEDKKQDAQRNMAWFALQGNVTLSFRSCDCGVGWTRSSR